MLRTSETAKSMCGLFFDQRPDNGAISIYKVTTSKRFLTKE
jgi:hypothetical protein